MGSRLQRLIRALVCRGTADGDRPSGVGTPGLAPCPDTPNCVSSRAADREHGVDPIAWPVNEAAGSRPSCTAIEAAAQVVARHPRGDIQTQTDDYLHATFRIPVFGFVDDVEFQWDEQAGVLHVRSASRVGHSDLGVNRRRVERIRRGIRRSFR